MTTKQISETIEDKYGIETSESFISDVTDKILPQIEDWLNRQRSVFPGPQALLKSLYLATFEATRKWTMPIRNWGKVRGELSVMYPERLPE